MSVIVSSRMIKLTYVVKHAILGQGDYISVILVDIGICLRVASTALPIKGIVLPKDGDEIETVRDEAYSVVGVAKRWLGAWV